MAFAYHAGTSIYTSAIGMCTAASLIPSAAPSPMFRSIAISSGLLMTLQFSSPSDIDGAKQVWKDLCKELDDAHIDLNSLTSGVNPEKWQNMGKEEFDAACKKFYEEMGKTRDCCNNIGDSLGGAAMMSFIAAVVCAVLGTILLKMAIAKAAASAAGPVGALTATTITTAGATTIRQKLRMMVVKSGKSLMLIGTIVMMGYALLQWLTSSTQQGLSQAATPMDTKSMPMFEQVSIEGLPQSFGGSETAPGYKPKA
ncbi:hypothetical protein [Streptosporangium minutum]|uniref:Uncharacterized protein n=1 Tax=Streptosporangium minutum TaxID=569862 RepID=A0A243RE19_9ACTN|nr:hypothetical protein [Streptosporangium minutum]OUC92966.1 hypothetical protein CA984_28095 [Streptosporangium minutum]